MPNCRQCNTAFEVTEEDRIFYQKISPEFGGQKYLIPEPTHCPECRLQRRTAWRNERCLYTRMCDRCKKSLVSIYSPNSGIPIYCNACWWGQGWDARDYGRAFDFSRPFFDQLQELLRSVPQLAIQNDDGVGSQNCQYCQDFAYGKNCYFVIGSWYSEDSFYCNINASYNRWVCDCSNVSHSELAYECTDSRSLYHCAFLADSENSSDCFFGFDLKGCRNCFGCVGLRQKQFYFFNQPLSEIEYKKKVAEFRLDSFAALEKIRADYTPWSLQFPRKHMNLQNCESSEGNHLSNCRNTFGFALLDADHARYSAQSDIAQFSHDIFNSGRPQWCYEGMTPDDSYMTHFSWFSWKNKNGLYAFNCHSSDSLFGCASLHRAKHCILNKQYTPAEYEALVPKIIDHMRSAKGGGEWGEFAPVRISFFGYNETVAHEYFPLSREEALAKGWKWHEPNPKEYQPQTFALPDSIHEVSDDLVREVLACGSCGKNYKIVPQELVFYRKMGLPAPRRCPDCRHRARIASRTPYKLFERVCAQCHAAIKTPYAPDRPEIVYCEACYIKQVY